MCVCDPQLSPCRAHVYGTDFRYIGNLTTEDLHLETKFQIFAENYTAYIDF